MKLSELRSVADEQLENGRKAKEELDQGRIALETAESERNDRYNLMEEAMEVDEDFRPKGDILAANEAFENAKEEHRTAMEAVKAGEDALEVINAGKYDTIEALESYIGETQGYRDSFRGAAQSRYVHTLKPLDDTFARHIENAETLRDELLSSMDEGTGGHNGAGGVLGSAGAEGLAGSGNYESTFPGIDANEGPAEGISDEERAYRDEIQKRRSEQFRQQVMNDPMAKNPLFSGVRQPEGAGGPCLTFGLEDENLGKLSYAQGNNTLGWDNDCSIAQIANILTLAGSQTKEQQVVEYVNSIKNTLVSKPGASPNPSDNGGLIPDDISTVLDHFGLPNEVRKRNAGIAGSIAQLFGASGGMDLDEIAEAVESGRGVILGVNHRLLNGYYGDITADHAISVVGTARNLRTHVVTGFYINDTGWPDRDGRLERSQTKFVPVWRIRQAYEVPNAAVILTRNVIR